MNIVSKVYEWLELAGKKNEYSSEGRTLALDLIQEEFEELVEAMNNGDRHEELNSCIDLFWVITNFAYFSGIPLESIKQHAALVEKENFSKFCLTEEDAIKTVEMYANGTHPNKVGTVIDTYYEKKGKYFIIKKKNNPEKDKILKAWNYQELT